VSGDPPLLGEGLAIDLANTVPGPRAPDLLADARTRGLWLAAERPALGDPGSLDEEEVLAVVELRGALRALLAAAALREAPPGSALDLVNEASARLPQAPQLNWPGDGSPSGWATAPGGSYAERLCAAAARSAIDLLTGELGDRIRRCPGPGCVRFFVAADPRRRWCSSRTCGNRVRVARHAARQRLR